MTQSRPSVTARWVAAQRARLHDDRPVLPGGDADCELRLYRGFSRGFLIPGLQPTGMALRTRFIDDEVMRALSAGVRQCVLVGAGYDGRALRFHQPGVRWFEVDHPSTQPDKRRRLAAAGNHAANTAFVPVDLLRDDVRTALATAGHHPNRPTLFICEGLFAYLPNDVVGTLCARLRDVAAPGSVLTASALVVPTTGGGIAQALVDIVLARLGERRLCVFHPGDVETLLETSGWTVQRRAASRNDDLNARHLLLVAVS